MDGEAQKQKEQAESFDAWCIVELFGRQVTAGRVTERTVAGHGFVQVDVPAVADQAGFSRLYHPNAIYGLTPVDEAIARAYAARNVGAPVQPYQLALPGHGMTDRDEENPDW